MDTEDLNAEGGVEARRHEIENFNQSNIIVRFFDSLVDLHKDQLNLKGYHEQRFKVLYNHWNEYLADFLRLRPIVTIVPRKMESGEGVDVNEHQILDERLWKRFVKKWHIPRSVDYEILLGYTQDTIQQLSKYPVPELQKLLLTDLPVELLEIIFGHTTKPGPLSSTCHYLREIGQPYLFRTRSLKFNVPSTVWNDLPTRDEDRLRYLKRIVHTSKEDFLRSANIVLSRPDLSAKLQDLYLTNEWTPSQFERIVPEFNPRAELDFYNPILDAFAQLLLSSRNLTMLTLNGLTLGLDIVCNICQIQSIHSLRLFSCDFRFEDRLLLREANVSCSAYNLQFTVSSRSTWLILLIRFPNLRTLGIRSENERDVVLPHPVVWSRNTFFHSIQRLSLSSIHNASIPLLPYMLASQPNGLTHLTHFKLYARDGVSDSIILDVLDALRSAPLEALVLEGIAQGSLATIDRVAEHFPNLLGLTLMRRESGRQHGNKLATWPHFSWEYAPRFSAFKKLQHFGWNFRMNELDCTPRGMILFEEGFLDHTPTFEELYNAEDGTLFEDNHFFDDNHCSALPFAAHCPTLQTFVVLYRSSIPTAFRISRGSDGALQVERPELRVPWNPWNINQWNPFHWTLGWPTIIPPK